MFKKALIVSLGERGEYDMALSFYSINSIVLFILDLDQILSVIKNFIKSAKRSMWSIQCNQLLGVACVTAIRVHGCII